MGSLIMSYCCNDHLDPFAGLDIFMAGVLDVRKLVLGLDIFMAGVLDVRKLVLVLELKRCWGMWCLKNSFFVWIYIKNNFF